MIGDSDRIDHIFGNLIDNAIKFTPPGRNIAINSQVDEKFARIAVADSGPGTPLEEQERIFIRLYQVDRSSSNANRGTGLGLSIAREIVLSHGSEIQVANGRVNILLECANLNGATFIVRLPYHDSDHNKRKTS
jgi:signal transduction histidine kinase